MLLEASQVRSWRFESPLGEDCSEYSTAQYSMRRVAVIQLPRLHPKPHKTHPNHPPNNPIRQNVTSDTFFPLFITTTNHAVLIGPQSNRPLSLQQ